MLSRCVRNLKPFRVNKNFSLKSEEMCCNSLTNVASHAELVMHSLSRVPPHVRVSLILSQNCFVIYRQLFLTSIASKNLKLFFTLDYVLKRANDLKTILN